MFDIMMKGGFFMPVKITTESAADLSEEIRKEFDISVIPMNIILDNKGYKDGVTLTTEKLLETKSVASTAAINEEEFKEFFRYEGENCDIVHVSLSSKISSTYQNAVNAAKDFDNIYVVDSLSLSAGVGLLCVIASQLASSGESAESIVSILKSKRDDIKTSFVLEDLERMKRGGRCTAVEALGANLLGIKPSIEMINGKLSPTKRYHGKGSAARLKYIERRITSDDPDRSVCFLNHTLENDREVKKLEETLKSEYDFERVFVNKAGCCISAHCGKNCMGIIYKH